MPEIKNNNQQEQREPVVNIQGLYKSYGKKEVLMGLDLQVYEGELFGLSVKTVLVSRPRLTALSALKSLTREKSRLTVTTF